MSNQRATWGSVKGTIGRPVGLCGDNPDLMDYYNEGVEALWNEGLWVGKLQIWKFRVVADCRGNKCIVFPTEIETLEMLSICGAPIGIRNVMWQFLSNSSGPIGSGGSGYRGGLTLVGDRQEVCTQHDLLQPSRIKVYTQRVEPLGQILILGYDENGNWVRTPISGGGFQDGEYISIANLNGSGATSTTTFASITGVQLTDSPRYGATYIYGLNSENEERQLGVYEFSTSIPVFRKYILGGLPNRWNNDTENDEQRCTCVTALVSLRFLPIMSDTDYVQISSIAALKEIIHWIYSRDNGKIDESEAHRQIAINILNKQLQGFNGFGAKKIINFGPKALLGTHGNVM